jgi:hypothetical protein
LSSINAFRSQVLSRLHGACTHELLNDVLLVVRSKKAVSLNGIPNVLMTYVVEKLTVVEFRYVDSVLILPLRVDVTYCVKG